MPLFKINYQKLELINEKSINLERDIQRLTEQNLKKIFGLEFVCSEFNIQNFFIDTLAFDPEDKSFVIIEYKRNQSFSVIDQGFNYLSLMLNNKSDFILEYNEKMNKNLNKKDIDWSQSRVIFIARSFTSYQQGALGFKDLPIELWEVKLYENNLILYNHLKPLTAQESIKNIKGAKEIERVSREIKTYDIEFHRNKADEKTKELFDELRKRIFALAENITEHPQKFYIGYKIDSGYINFSAIEVYKSKLQVAILIPSKKLKDPKKLTKSFPKSYGWAKNLKKFVIKDTKDLQYAMTLIEQSYNYNKGR